jgi:transposase
VVEQKQLIGELNVTAEHLAQLETAMAQVVANCRKGVILTSIPGIGPQAAATLIAMIGTIANFEYASQLKSYERTRRLIGREKVMGRLAGQMTCVISTLLKRDQEVLAHLTPGSEPPPL